MPDFILESVQSLPPLPSAVQRLLSLTRDIDVDFDKVAQIIESDQVLTARILRAANSALYGMSRRIETVQKATVLLGRESILNLALSSSMLNLYNRVENKWPIKPAAFWRHNIAVAHTAQWLAHEQRLQNPESAFVAGLMHDIGKLVMLTHHRDDYADLLHSVRAGETPLTVLEREVFDIDHAKVGSLLCKHWKLPDTTTEAVALHHAPPSDDTTLPPVARVVRSANVLIKMCRIGKSGARVVDLGFPANLPHEAVDPDALYAYLRELPLEVHQAEKAFTKTPKPQPTIIPEDERTVVHVQLDRPRETPLVGTMLTAMGYAPVTNPDAAHQPASVRLTETVDDADTQALNYGSWRADQEVTCEMQYLPIDPLRQWLGWNLRSSQDEG